MIEERQAMIQKESLMISALSGSTSAQLLSVFARPLTTSTVAIQVAQRIKPSIGPPPGPPRSAGNGAHPQSLFDAMSTPISASSALDDLLSNLFNRSDTDGDAKLSVDELKAAVASVQGDTTGPDTASTDAASTATATFHSTGAKSLSESRFNAVASMNGTNASSSQMNDLSQKWLTTFTA